MLLTGIVLFMVGQLTSQTFGTLKFLQQKAQTLQAATLGLDRLASELREAVDVRPGSGSVEFDKVNFAAPPCVNNVPTDDPTTWTRNYAAISQVGTVQYQVSGTTLNRTVTFGGTQTTEVATDVDDFQVNRAPTVEGVQAGNNVFELVLSINEDRKIQSFRTVVMVPGEAP